MTESKLPEDTIEKVIEKVIDLARVNALQWFVIARDSPDQILESEPHGSVWVIFYEQFPDNYEKSHVPPTTLDFIFQLAYTEFISKLWSEYIKDILDNYKLVYFRENKPKPEDKSTTSTSTSTSTLEYNTDVKRV